ncbi:MAG: VWA domain-containing protein [Phycisphaerae bacterium]|nr:VWA domain-containing protein [Gemmatimonadaceae bacterium]
MTIAGVLQHLTPNEELIGDAIPAGLGGLRLADGRAFPLKSVKARASIAGPCARTVVEQHFVNGFDEVLDVTWIFPLPSDGAIVALALRAGDINVIGECRKRADASAQFNAARDDGKRVVLLETEQRGVHTLSLAGLPPRTDVYVQVTVVELLPSVDARFRWQFPTTIAPRYTPGAEMGHDGWGAADDTDLVPNASRLTPPLRLNGGTLLDLEVEIAAPVSSVASSLHAVRMLLDSGAVRIAPSALTTLNRDFVLEFGTAQATAVETRAYTDGRYTVAIVQPPADVATGIMPRDAVFVVDISGSMEGAKLDAAKAALVGALHGLQRDDRFRLIAFDDRVEQFRDGFVEYNERNLRAADRWVESLEARGGTEMLEAVKESLAGETATGRLRTVLFITDGQSNDEGRLLPAVANRRGNAVFFTLGIDTAVNESLLKQLAKAGGGTCELCTPTDDIDAIVARLESRFGSPLLSDVVAPGAARPNGQTVFSGRPATVLIDGAPDTIEITATSLEGAFRQLVTPEQIAFSLGPIWARERVSFLEERLAVRPFEEEALKPEIERIALAHGIASKFTSFVCVDHSVRSHGERRHVVQAVELPAEWEGAAFGVGGGQPPALLFMPLYAPMPSASRSSKRAQNSSRHLDASRLTAADFAEIGEHETVAFAENSLVSEDISVFSDRAMLDTPVYSSDLKADNAADNSVSTLLGWLARRQNANGSYGDDVGRSVAALLLLVMFGCTRRKGDRRRTVKKLAEWLESNSSDSRAAFALSALEDAEASRVVDEGTWANFGTEGDEGTMLRAFLDRPPAV